MVWPALRIKCLYGFRDERRLLTLYVPYEWPKFSINISIYNLFTYFPNTDHLFSVIIILIHLSKIILQGITSIPY